MSNDGERHDGERRDGERRDGERRESERRESEQGVALVSVMTAAALLAALAGSLTLAVITDTAVAANYRDAAVARYAAEAAVEFVLPELAAAEDWSDLLSGGQSAFTDGPPGGTRLVGAEAIDFDREAGEVAAAAMTLAGAVDLPPVLHASGWFRDMVPGTAADVRVYVAVWVADRSPAPKDEGAPVERLSVVGEAIGTGGTRRGVEAIIQKADTSAVRLLAWRELP